MSSCFTIVGHFCRQICGQETAKYQQCPKEFDQNEGSHCKEDLFREKRERRKGISLTLLETSEIQYCCNEMCNLSLDALSNHGTSHLHDFLSQRKTMAKTVVVHTPLARTTGYREHGQKAPFQQVRKVSFLDKRVATVKATRKAAIVPFERGDATTVSIGRRNSILNSSRRSRRCSEPFLFNAPLSSKAKKQSVGGNRLPYSSRRRLSTTAALLPATSKHKLHALAKDELLASLNLPLDIPEQSVVKSIKDENATAEKTEDENQQNEDRRIKVIQEILETEKKYLLCLITLDQVFRKPLLDVAIVPEKDIKLIFPSVLNDIRTCHSWFVQGLEQRINDMNSTGMVGDAFAKLSDSNKDDLLEMYTGYVNAFPKSVSTLSKCTRTSHKFRRFLEMCAENPQCDHLELTSFLLTPVQRLPRYVLLLRQLLKYTKKDHPDHVNLSEALQKMEGLIESLNDSIQNSMQVYSAGESERRRLLRRQLSRRKKKPKITSAEIRPNPSPSAIINASALQNRRSSSTPDVNAATGALQRNLSSDSHSSLPLRNRNSESGRSTKWRRSFGAMFSSVWQSKDEKEFGSEEVLASPTFDNVEQDSCPINSNKTKRHSVSGGVTSGSIARRKYGVAYPTETISPTCQYIQDTEVNNNELRSRKQSNARDKKRLSWLSLNGTKHFSTGSDDEFHNSSKREQFMGTAPLMRSTSSSVISETERTSSKSNFHRSIRSRMSGRSLGLPSFFQKGKQRASCENVFKSSEELSHLSPKNAKDFLPRKHRGGLVRATVSDNSRVTKPLPCVENQSNESEEKTRRQSAPVDRPGPSEDTHRGRIWSDESYELNNCSHHEVPSVKTVVKPPKESKGKIKKALKQIVGRTKS